jgi:hypothetical protein
MMHSLAAPTRVGTRLTNSPQTNIGGHLQKNLKER